MSSDGVAIWGFFTSSEHFHKHFDLNVLGLLLTTQEAVKLIGPSGGSIVNMSSFAGTSAPPNTSVYRATKAAVNAITRSLAQELGPRKTRARSRSTWGACGSANATWSTA